MLVAELLLSFTLVAYVATTQIQVGVAVSFNFALFAKSIDAIGVVAVRITIRVKFAMVVIIVLLLLQRSHVVARCVHHGGGEGGGGHNKDDAELHCRGLAS